MLSRGAHKTREERKICLKIRLFGFPRTLVYRLATTAARKVVLPSTLIGPFEFERALTTRPSTGGKCTFTRQNANFSFFTGLSAAEAHVFGVKNIGLCGTVVFIAIRNFFF